MKAPGRIDCPGRWYSCLASRALPLLRRRFHFLFRRMNFPE
jgi:hypothetical protein